MVSKKILSLIKIHLNEKEKENLKRDFEFWKKFSNKFFKNFLKEIPNNVLYEKIYLEKEYLEIWKKETKVNYDKKIILSKFELENKWIIIRKQY